MRYRFCPHCGMRYISTARGDCPHCGETLHTGPEPQAAPTEAEPAAPEPPPQAAPQPEPLTPPRGVEPVEPVAEALPREAAAEPSGSPLEGDQIRCPHCGEALYRGEQVCWNCGRRVVTGEAVAEGMPASGAPLSAADRGWREELPPDYQPPPPQEAMTTAYWALGLGLASVLTCGAFAFLGPVALWLGIRATREGAGPVAVAGLVLGALGTLVLGVGLAWLVIVVTRLGPEFSWAIGSGIAASLPLLQP